MAKIGRNQPCPCGSGRKYKKCHGSLQNPQLPAAIVSRLREVTERAMAQEVQRERQQGLGRPIISAEAFGRRFVAVKNRLMHSDKWRTFHDFLVPYLATAMGAEWGTQSLPNHLSSDTRSRFGTTTFANSNRSSLRSPVKSMLAI